jgi:glycogen(starch) synthase
MLGWEFPPLHSGGLGVATKNLAMALSNRGIPICFALPHFAYTKWKEKGGSECGFEVVAHMYPGGFELMQIKSSLVNPYITEEAYTNLKKEIDANEPGNGNNLYGSNLFEEVERYAHEVENMAQNRNFSMVHAHDWLTFAAGMRVKKKQDQPFVAQIHATEIDRSGENPNEEIFKREREGLEAADKIIAVSQYTKKILQKHYGLKHKDICVVHNGVEKKTSDYRKPAPRFHEKKTVLFLGRLVMQKGPDWFVKIAKKVIEKEQNVQFLIAGTGHMMPQVLNDITHHGLHQHVIPLGFLNETEREKAFRNTDVYVMPSVSEPFGLSAVEAAQRGIPTVISKQSGVKEVLGHSLAADFWDVDKMAHLILATLHYKPLHRTLSKKAEKELDHLTWDKQAGILHDEYKKMTCAV